MPRDKTENHVKLVAAARAEFLEYGFEKASMRSIGERCGLTAAAIYRHSRDKEDLFHQIVSPAVSRLDEWQEDHIARYAKALDSNEKAYWQDSWIDMMREIVYPNMEDYHLLLAKSQGTRYANFLHELVEKSQEQFQAYLPILRREGLPVQEIDPLELHLLFTAYSTALFEPVVHNYSQQDAFRCLKTVEAFFLPGWKQLLGF